MVDTKRAAEEAKSKTAKASVSADHIQHDKAKEATQKEDESNAAGDGAAKDDHQAKTNLRQRKSKQSKDDAHDEAHAD